MSPKLPEDIEIIDETGKNELTLSSENMNFSPKPYQMKIKWFNVFVMILLHIGAFIGVHRLLTCSIQTILFSYVYGVFSGMGVSAGVHRLWAHRSYKARLPLRIMLMCFNCISLQNDIYSWTRDHRSHHKFSETDADPHNSKRGFFFSHIGWLLCKKHPEVIRQGKKVNLSDLLQDPVVMFQHRFYFPLAILFSVYIPTMIPIWGWNEELTNAIFVAVFYRYIYTLHVTWFVNSISHTYGSRPYNKSIQPREFSFVSYCTYGEGYHNYHHTFPYDYSASELSWRHNFNFTTMFIDWFAYIGWAYDLRKVPSPVVHKRIERSGDIQQYPQASFNMFTNILKQLVFGTVHLWLPLSLRFIKNLV